MIHTLQLCCREPTATVNKKENKYMCDKFIKLTGKLCHKKMVFDDVFGFEISYIFLSRDSFIRDSRVLFRERVFFESRVFFQRTFLFETVGSFSRESFIRDSRVFFREKFSHVTRDNSIRRVTITCKSI